MTSNQKPTTKRAKTPAEKLGEFITKQRERKELSLRGLAKTVGIDVHSLDDLERGKVKTPDPNKLNRIAGALDVAIEDMYAIVGYTAPTGLPEFGVYLRSKYGLTDQSVEELDAYMAKLKARDEKGGRRAKPNR